MSLRLNCWHKEYFEYYSIEKKLGKRWENQPCNATLITQNEGKTKETAVRSVLWLQVATLVSDEKHARVCYSYDTILAFFSVSLYHYVCLVVDGLYTISLEKTLVQCKHTHKTIKYGGKHSLTSWLPTKTQALWHILSNKFEKYKQYTKNELKEICAAIKVERKGEK